jgi:beta-glucosidase
MNQSGKTTGERNCLRPFLCNPPRITLWFLIVRALVHPLQAQTSWTNSALHPDVRADLLLAEMTLDEKLAMVHGVAGQYIGTITNNSRLGIPEVHLQDGPAGIANSGMMYVTALPAPIALAASWDTALSRQYGTVLGTEARGKGVQVLLAPMIHTVRVPQGGRNFETFGEDPFLLSAMAAANVQGIQSQGVIATPKTFICNDQETDRGLASADVDERTLQEIYYAPFRASVRSGAGAVMTAYNLVNGRWASEAPQLGTVLKVMWGFRGFAVCDWGASFTPNGGANNGLDLEMPLEAHFGEPLQTTVQSGAVAELQVDEMVHRILATLFRFGIFDSPTNGSFSADVTSAAHTQFARDVAAQGIVLLKNTNDVLPLDPASVHSIAVLGSAGGSNPIWVGNGSAWVYLPYYDVPVNAISNRAGPGIVVNYLQGDGGSITQAVQLAQQADVAIVCVGEQTGEGTDRSSLSLPGDQDALVSAVAAVNPRTVVVLYENAGTLMPWTDQVASALVAWYPGQEGGRALASVLFGDVNPSGKLPVTFPMASNQVPANMLAQFPGTNYHTSYSERLLVGYRWYDASNVPPRFAFGHGLSYTTFGYSNLTISSVSPAGQVAIGVDVRNSGSRAGAEVAQLYLGFPAVAGEPPKQLKGFQKVLLQPGETRRVTFNLDWEDLAYWDVAGQAWAVPAGNFQVMAGASSRDIRLTGAFTLSSAVPTSGVANQALFQPVTASSMLATNSGGSAAVDGDPATCWTSLPGVPQLITVDLGAIKSVARVRLIWNTNYASGYQIRFSNDNTNWITQYTQTNGAGGSEDLLVPGSGRFVRLRVMQMASSSGCSLEEFEVYSPEVQLQPALSLRRTSTNTFCVSWPASWGGTFLLSNSFLNWGAFTLQENIDLHPTNWTSVNGTVVAVDGTNQVILAPTAKRFYRLHNP